MGNKKHICISSIEQLRYSVKVDGIELADYISKLYLWIEPNSLPHILIDVLAHDLDIDTDGFLYINNKKPAKNAQNATGAQK